MSRSREKDLLEKLSCEAQKVFKFIGVKGNEGFVGLTLGEISEDLVIKKRVLTDNEVNLGLAELQKNGFVRVVQASKGLTFQYTDKGDKAFL